jgi:membrane protein YdbS with pleckstrin-like domain
MTQSDQSRDTAAQEPGGLEGQAPHRPADDQEEVYYHGTPLFRAAVGTFLLWWIIGLGLIAAGVAGLVMGLFAASWWIAIPLMALGVIALLVPVIQLKSVRYRITNYRIDYERGVLTKKVDTLELWHVDDISFEQGLFERMFGVGTIIVMSHDPTTPKLTLRGIPRPRSIFDSLKQRIIAVKRQRGVIKMDLGN